MKSLLRKESWPILGILFLALALRIAGIGFGLPQLYHQDEPVIVNHAMAIGARGWNPHFFVLPPFSIYALFALYAVFFILGKLTGHFADASAFGSVFLNDPTAFYLIGRVVLGVFFGVLAVYWLYRVGTKHFSRKTGIYSALFLSVCYLHASQSHYIYSDIPLVFFLIAILGAFLSFCDEPSVANRVILGALIGLAVSAKYTAAYFLPVYTIFYFFGTKYEGFWRKTVLWASVGAAALAVYAAAAPFTFISWHEFYSQIHAQSGAEGYLGLFYHFRYSLINGIGMPVLFLAGAGLFAMSFFSRFKAGLVLSLCLFYYGVNVVFSQPFTRYMLPLAPFLCLAAGFGWGVMEQALGPVLRRTVLALIILGSVLPVIYLNALFLGKDTRDDCLAWVESHVAPDSVVVRDNAFYAPHLTQSPGQIKEKYDMLDPADTVKRKRLDLLSGIASTRKTYRVYTLSEKAGTEEGFLFQKPFVGADWKALKSINAQYLIINYSQFDPELLRFKDSIADRLELLASFSPFRAPDRKVMPDQFSCTAAPDSLTDLFSRKRLGPYLEVYRIKP